MLTLSHRSVTELAIVVLTCKIKALKISCMVFDLLGNPVWNLRTKTPQNEQTTVPWHQDNAYLDSSSLRVLQPTAWVPLVDTNTKNGCMQVR